jgi:hypothetical protein
VNIDARGALSEHSLEGGEIYGRKDVSGSVCTELDGRKDEQCF